MRFADNGSGISADAKKHLFELFADSNKNSGMGLGLWLCNHIISYYGGRICYEDAEGGRTQFVVFLPESPL